MDILEEYINNFINVIIYNEIKNLNIDEYINIIKNELIDKYDNFISKSNYYSN